MSINIKSVNKLEEQYRVIHPEHGELVAVMGSQQLKDLLILITDREQQAYGMCEATITPRYEGRTEGRIYMIKEQHYNTINALAGSGCFKDGHEMVSRDTYDEAQEDDELVSMWAMINKRQFYFIKRKPEPFKWVKDRSPLDTIRVNDMVLVYCEAYKCKVTEVTARGAKRDGLSWADVKHKDRFTADNPAPSPYDQST